MRAPESASEKMNSLFHLLTRFWSMLLQIVCYRFYSQPEKALASISINPKLVTFALFVQPRTMITPLKQTVPERKSSRDLCLVDECWATLTSGPWIWTCQAKSSKNEKSWAGNTKGCLINNGNALAAPRWEVGGRWWCRGEGEEWPTGRVDLTQRFLGGHLGHGRSHQADKECQGVKKLKYSFN